MAAFEDYLRKHTPIILDGGLATELEAQGYELKSKLWSAELLMHHPQAIINAHRAYFEAGANCTISASYQATLTGFMSLGLSAAQAQALIVKSVSLAMTARDEFLQAHPDINTRPLVAASVGPYGASLADGSEYVGNYQISDEQLSDFHRDRLNWLDYSGADILACETIPSLQEARVLHDLLSQCKTPSWVSFSCKDGLHISDGTAIKDCALLFKQHPRVKAIGVNCTSPAYINDLITEINTTNTELAIVVYPNSGESYNADTNSWSGTSTPIECGSAAKLWLNSGAKIIGGCCRMGPEHIHEIHQQLCGD